MYFDRVSFYEPRRNQAWFLTNKKLYRHFVLAMKDIEIIYHVVTPRVVTLLGMTPEELRILTKGLSDESTWKESASHVFMELAGEGID